MSRHLVQADCVFGSWFHHRARSAGAGRDQASWEKIAPRSLLRGHQQSTSQRPRRVRCGRTGELYLERAGFVMNAKRMHRLWRTAKLQLPKKRPRKRVRGTARDVPESPITSNEVWSYDFVFDHAANGQQIKCLTVVDEGTSEGLAIDVAGSIRSRRVIEVLSRLISERGAPKVLRSDNGPEFVSHALLKWIADAGIESALIEPGKPWQNGTCESFNGKFRDECLSIEWFRSREEARVLIEQWRRHYKRASQHPSVYAIEGKRLC
jgi:putative transposase